MIPPSSPFWLYTGAAAALLFFFSIVPAALFIRQRQIGRALACLPLIGVSYGIFQCADLAANSSAVSQAGKAVAVWASHLPRAVFPGLLCLVLLGGAAALAAGGRYEHSHITPMSIKEAVDKLPVGVLMYLPGGRVVLVNRAMEQCCLRLTGIAAANGEAFRRQLLEGTLQPGCRRETVQKTPLVVLSDGTAYSVTEKDAPYQGTRVHCLLLYDVTETYHKTLSLQEMQAAVAALNRQLTTYNRDIVAMTAEKELLNARVKLHNQMGEDLLSMKRFIRDGGTEETRRDIETMLHRNITFLKTGQTPPQQDEYTLLLKTAEKLGARIFVQGDLPMESPCKHVIATAIHECFTNMLRHAHGDEMTVNVTQTEHAISVRITNNGISPTGPIQEKGGLSTLRRLTEQAGGSLCFAFEPAFSMILSLPKEVPHGLQGIDCG